MIDLVEKKGPDELQGGTWGRQPGCSKARIKGKNRKRSIMHQVFVPYFAAANNANVNAGIPDITLHTSY